MENEFVLSKRINKPVHNCIGKRYGIITAIEILGFKNGDKHSYIKCLCDCGKEKVVRFTNLNQGRTKSCGCAIIKHGDAKSKLYVVWMGIKNRCNLKLKHYGADGISVCDEWNNNYLSFKEWALKNGWKDGLEIDRFPDRKGNYEPKNCRIVTKLENIYNRDVTLYVSYKGELKTVGDLSSISGLPRKIIYSRIFINKMNIEKALNKPYKKRV